MKGIKIVVTVLTCLILITFIEAGSAQIGKKESAPQQSPPQQEAKLVTIIKDCYVPYIDWKKLYAVVETSVAPSEEKGKDTGENRGIGKGKSTATEKKQTVQQTFEYAISPDVEVRERGERGSRLDLNSVAGVGFITKADIYVEKNEVVKIIILEMQQ